VERVGDRLVSDDFEDASVRSNMYPHVGDERILRERWRGACTGEHQCKRADR
jgi:hypothetical protein